MTTDGRTRNGGARPGAGALQVRLHLDRDTAQALRVLTFARRGVTGNATLAPVDVATELIRAAYAEYEISIEARAGESGEGDGMNAIEKLNEMQFSGERHPELGAAQDALIAAENVTRTDWLVAVEASDYTRCPICGSRIRTIESGTECTDGYCISQFLP